MEKTKFSTRARCRSFRYAFNGLRILFSREHNAWIHLAAAFCAVAAGWLLRVSRGEWIALAIVIGAVFAAEALNSAVESLCDRVCRESDPKIGEAKDLAAAGVLVAALAAAVTGALIFVPRIIELFARS